MDKLLAKQLVAILLEHPDAFIKSGGVNTKDNNWNGRNFYIN